MMFRHRLIFLSQSDWVVAFFLLAIFLITNGYKYNWDDQHIEIPLLKSLIDPGLYVGDYYIESLKKNFTSFMFPILARVISVGQVPMAYFLLFLVSRYFLFFWLYKLWKYICADRFLGFTSVAVFILIGRVPEFLYRTFSHQEFTLALIFAGIYFFYKERFILASAILGIASNFHALYALFPMIYLQIFLIIQIKRYRFLTLLQTTVSFIIFAIPFLIWTTKRFLTQPESIDPQIYTNWYALFKIACPQNFVFLEIPLDSIFKDLKSFSQALPRYLVLIVLYILNWVHNDSFRKDKKVMAAVITTGVLLGVSFFFSYIQPNRFVLDLNLVRNTQYLHLFLIGYATIILFRSCTQMPPWGAAILAFLLYLVGFGDLIATLAFVGIFGVISLFRLKKREEKFQNSFYRVLVPVLLGISGGGIIYLILIYKFRPGAISNFYLALGLIVLGFFIILIWKILRNRILSNVLLIFIPILLTFAQYSYYHWEHLKIEKQGLGFWQLQRDWEDMQIFVQKNTPKDALFLVPNDMEMGGFRILSERKIICCYRDCGIVGFDYKTAVEWQRRLADIESFKVMADSSIKPALLTALLQYRVNYIVFMRYYSPPANTQGFEKMYENGSFSLFKVVSH